MNLYLIRQKQNNGYDTFDSAVVCAESEEAAARIHPSGYSDDWAKEGDWEDSYSCWASHPSQVKVKLLGVASPAIERGIICASFNAD